MDCTRCHKKKELAKGKRWCKDCKNEYERERRKNTGLEKRREYERNRYKENKLKVVEVVLDANKNKTCSICKIDKTEIDFHVAKCRGIIRSMCKDCSSLKRKEHYKKNREAIIKQTSNYKVEKMKVDPIFKMEVRMRTRISNALKVQSCEKNKRTWKYLECTVSQFQKWIEYQLYDGMTMDNYGKYWHIDHVKPCSKFDLSKEEEIKKCFSWENLRPFVSEKNRKKANKINIYDIVLQELKVKCFLKDHAVLKQVRKVTSRE